MNTEGWVVPVVAVSIGASLIAIYLLVDRLSSGSGGGLPSVVSRRTEYIRDSSGRIIEKYEEVSFSDGTQVVRNSVPVATQARTG